MVLWTHISEDCGLLFEKLAPSCQANVPIFASLPAQHPATVKERSYVSKLIPAFPGFKRLGVCGSESRGVKLFSSRSGNRMILCALLCGNAVMQTGQSHELNET